MAGCVYEWFVSYPINIIASRSTSANTRTLATNTSARWREALDGYTYCRKSREGEGTVQAGEDDDAIFEKYSANIRFNRDGYKLVECPHTGMEHQTCVAYGNHYLGGYRGVPRLRSGSNLISSLSTNRARMVGQQRHDEGYRGHVDSRELRRLRESRCSWRISMATMKPSNTQRKKGNVRNDRPIIAEYGRYQRSAQDMYDKGQLILNTLRSVLDDDALWVSIMRGIQEKIQMPERSADEVFAFINQKAGPTLLTSSTILPPANIPTLVVQTVQEGRFCYRALSLGSGRE